MGYRITIERRGCINCGVCMDVCPVQALDMTRPDHSGVEAAGTSGRPFAWMMEYPVQVGECIGCGICIGECPVQVMDLDTVAGATPLLARQGPIHPPAAEPGWTPLSEATLEVLKPDHPSPFEPGYRWGFADRAQPWPVWSAPGAVVPTPQAPCQTACPAGTDAGRYVGLLAEGKYADAYAVAAEVNPFPSVCGWICTAPCEAACRRGTLDEPIAIRTLKRFAAEHGQLPPVPPGPMGMGPQAARRERGGRRPGSRLRGPPDRACRGRDRPLVRHADGRVRAAERARGVLRARRFGRGDGVRGPARPAVPAEHGQVGGASRRPP